MTFEITFKLLFSIYLNNVDKYIETITIILKTKVSPN